MPRRVLDWLTTTRTRRAIWQRETGTRHVLLAAWPIVVMVAVVTFLILDVQHLPLWMQ